MSQTPKKWSWLKRPQTIAWVVCGIIAVLVFGILLWVQGCATDSEAIRNYIWGVGGVGALLGVWLASIRGNDFTEQVKTQTRQTELQTQQTRSETLSRCVEQIGNKDSATIRTAGIHGLEILARDNQSDAEFLQHVCNILQGFLDEHAPVRWEGKTSDSSKESLVAATQLFGERLKILQQRETSRKGKLSKSEKKLIEWEEHLKEHWKKHKAEVEQAIHTFAVIVAMNPRILGGPDLSCRYLPYLQTSRGTNSSTTNLLETLYPSKPKYWNQKDSKASLRRAVFGHSLLYDANFERQDLRGAHFLGANLAYACFKEARLIKANLKRANLYHAEFGKLEPPSERIKKTDLRRAKLYGANLGYAVLAYGRFYKADLQNALFFETHLTGADFKSANLQGAVHGLYIKGKMKYSDILKDSKKGTPVTIEWLKEQEVENADDAKGIPDR